MPHSRSYFVLKQKTSLRSLLNYALWHKDIRIILRTVFGWNWCISFWNMWLQIKEGGATAHRPILTPASMKPSCTLPDAKFNVSDALVAIDLSHF